MPGEPRRMPRNEHVQKGNDNKRVSSLALSLGTHREEPMEMGSPGVRGEAKGMLINT